MIKNRSSQAFLRIRVIVSLISLMSLTLVFLPKQACAVTATVAEERAIWEFWQNHEAAPDDHKAGITACLAFRKAHPNNPFLVVADTIRSWHLLKLDRPDEAVALLKPYIKKTADTFERGAQLVCAAWLARIDMQHIQQALQFYYRREIAYPETLAELAVYKALPEKLAFPMKDCWGDDWNYQLVGYSRMPDLLNQKYSLTYRQIEKNADLKKALAIPYASQIRIRPTGVTSRVEGRENNEIEVEETSSQGLEGVEQEKRTLMVNTGIRTHGSIIAYSGKYIVLVCDFYHWKVFLKPTAR